MRKGTIRYSELMLGQRDITVLLNSLSCILTFGSRLQRLASKMAAATAVSTTAPVPTTTGLPSRVIAAVQGCLLLLLCRLPGLTQRLRPAGVCVR